MAKSFNKFVGRETEKTKLEQLYRSNEAEFIAVYGRRRVGKTYLIRTFFKKKGLYFELTGEKDGSLASQLENFSLALARTFYPDLKLRPPTSWKEAFHLLTQEISKQPRSKKVIIFIDELPWLASPRSQLMSALDHIWNTDWSQRKNLKLVVCGSAASWMLNHLIQARGGLYNRLTATIQLKPFTLYETYAYLKSRGHQLSLKQILDLYMVIGGIPHYLKQLEKNKSVAQNIQELCFQKSGLLYLEFNHLFESLFDHADEHRKIMKAVATHRYGISRAEILKKLGRTSGGGFKKRLDELEAAGFIESFIPLGRKKKDFYLKVIDEYSLFYFHWIHKIDTQVSKNYWLQQSQQPKAKVWAGLSFEAVCFKHIQPIQKALGLNQIACQIGSWRLISPPKTKNPGVQIDLVFDREDNAVTICEIKYNQKVFVIDKGYGKELVQKLEAFEEYRGKQVFLAMITASGLKKNLWSEELVSAQVELKDLFAH